MSIEVAEKVGFKIIYVCVIAWAEEESTVSLRSSTTIFTGENLAAQGTHCLQKVILCIYMTEHVKTSE